MLLKSFHPFILIIQKMLKGKGTTSKETFFKVEEVEGPPIDFSFKNLRALHQLLAIGSQPKPGKTEESLKQSESIGQHVSEKELAQGTTDTKLNIIRTIDVEGGKEDMLKHLVNKKTEKAPTKVFKKTITKTTSLFLRYNKFVSLDGFSQILQQLIPNKWDQLMWIDLSHNRLTTVSKELQVLPTLKTLYLHVNFISSFKQLQNLQGAHLLRTFTIHGNPLQNYPEFRSLITGILPQVQKIDSVLLTKRQKQRGEILRKQGGKYPIIPNAAKPPEQSQEEQQG